MSDKLGTYINDEFVRELALSELKNLNLKIEEFLHDNKKK